MNVAPEVLVWIGGGIFAQFTITVHLLIRILVRVAEIDKRQALQEQEMKFHFSGERKYA